jgi:hypothetical protein
VVPLALGCASTLGTVIFAQSGAQGNTADWVTLANTVLLIILNVIVTRNGRTARQVQRTMNESLPTEDETVQSTRYTDANGDEHIVLHRYRSGHQHTKS